MIVQGHTEFDQTKHQKKKQGQDQRELYAAGAAL
jgi:hypothetical protein